ncbi:hypothetical protein NDU88_005783 [Pleurodeles waltl]|uniref:Uncharacterized protein n=1 Tax=Pleurodeles waltl TaxID=8319 RepID=A0AAV7MB22_PLEWA|nr:hypothetical protein NDU88_005783 [Pleurodeles waltl]
MLKSQRCTQKHPSTRGRHLGRHLVADPVRTGSCAVLRPAVQALLSSWACLERGGDSPIALAAVNLRKMETGCGVCSLPWAEHVIGLDTKDLPDKDAVVAPTRVLHWDALAPRGAFPTSRNLHDHGAEVGARSGGGAKTP